MPYKSLIKKVGFCRPKINLKPLQNLGYMKRFFLPLFMAGLVWACGPQNATDTPEETTETIDPSAKTDAQEAVEISPEEAIPFTIAEDNVFGISIGQPIADIELPIEESVREGGEGEEAIYVIKSEKGERLGYFYPHIDEVSRVGTIVVSTKNAQTEEGIRVGMAYGDLKEIIRDFDVSGSPIEPQATVYYKKFAFKLDHNSTEYELKPEEVPEEAKIIEIAAILKIEE